PTLTTLSLHDALPIYTLGELHIGDVNGLADAERAYIELDVRRNLARHTRDDERPVHLVQRAAFLDAGGLAGQKERYHGAHRLVGDRKSTRLNSSHSQI